MQDEQAKNAFISVVGICSIYLTLTLGTAIFQQLDHFLLVTFDIPSIFSTYAIFLILVFSINKRGGGGTFLIGRLPTDVVPILAVAKAKLQILRGDNNSKKPFHSYQKVSAMSQVLFQRA